MAKGGSSASTSTRHKSSASSATRKKHARKAALASGEPEEPQVTKEKKPKGKEKGSKRSKEPRKKVYIPPVKPAAVQPDPLDTLGIAQRIPAELLVVLRKLAKKDSVTKRRALEDFFADWVEKSRGNEDLLSVLEVVLPVWLHHLPVLFLHPQRRLRLLAAKLHAALLGLPQKAAEVSLLLREGTSSDQADVILGSWLLATHDPDPQVCKAAKDSWSTYVLADPTISAKSSQIPLDDATHRLLWEFVERVVLDPGGVYMQVNPPQPAAPPPPVHQQRKGGGRNVPTAWKGDETPTRTKPEEDEEEEVDRHARLRIAGFGSIEWILGSPYVTLKDVSSRQEVIGSLDNAALWSSLYHGQHAPFLHEEMDAFGWNQPGVRKACWSLLQLLLKTHSDCLGVLEQTLSAATLRSAWVEPDVAVRNTMWGALLLFLREHPRAWEHEARSSAEDEAHEYSDSDGDDDETGDNPAKTISKERKLTRSLAYDEFRQFLELGCMGTPAQAYPAIIIVLSTIPSSILALPPTPVQTLFNSFWAAVDGRALSGLDRAVASAAFLSSVLECTVFLVRRLIGEQGKELLTDSEADGRQAATELITDKVKRVWEEVSTERLKLNYTVAAGSLAKTLLTLHTIDEEFFNAAWTVLDSAVRQQVTEATSVSSFVPAIMKAFQTTFAATNTRPREVTETLIKEVLHSSIDRFGSIIRSNESLETNQPLMQTIAAILDAFASDIFADEELASDIDQACLEHSYQLLKVSTPVLVVYLSKREDDALRSRVWKSVLQTIEEKPEESSSSLDKLLRLVESGSIPQSLGSSDGELDDTAGRLLASALSERDGHAQALDTLKRMFASYKYFISEDCLRGLVSSICGTFAQHVQASLHKPELSTPSLAGILSLLNVVVDKNLAPRTIPSVLPDLFLYAHFIPLVEAFAPGHEPQHFIAANTFLQCIGGLEEELRQDILAIITQRLRDIVFDCMIPVRISTLVDMLSRASDLLGTNLTADVSPAQPELDSMLKRLPEQPAHVNLAVIDPLVLISDWEETELSEVPEFDSLGFSSYARGVLFLLLHHLDDRSVANENIWALRHFQALAVYVKDLSHAPSMQSAVFAPHVAKDALDDVINRVEQLTAYIVAHNIDDGWFSRVLPNLSSGKIGQNADGVEKLLHGLLNAEDNARESRILHAILKHVLSGATKADADQFVMLARKTEKRAPHLALAIIYSVTQYAPEPPRLDRLRNELAAELFGIPASKVNTDGLWLLRRLAAVAPDPESDVVYLPTPRAVNLMKACQQWITSDEELEEEVEFQMTTIFFHLAPILQTVPGAHWDLIYDLMENSLENCSFSEPTTLPLLHRTLKLLIAVEELTSTNKALRATWDERRLANLRLVKDLVAKPLESENADLALSVCRELALTVIQDLPEQLINKDSISQMCHLIMDASENVPRMSYKVLSVSAAKYTEHLVLEASVDTEPTVPINLPVELVQLVQNGLQGEDVLESAPEQTQFGHLLAWMLVFDLFANSSLKVKIGYINDMRRQGLITDYFLPQIFSILRLEDGLGRAFKLDMWAIDEYYLDFTDTDTPLRVSLLAAHLYYRALRLVPGLVRDWLRDCRDRQLNSTVSSYTSTHFSPVIVSTELAQLKSADAAADLADENMTVKVASAVNEVTAAYTVDEYTLELKLRLPNDWPLRPAEVTDTAPVGVKEDRWKSWVLGVQQILTFRGGSIVDGISFFKKNIASHFEGQAECAICYSMISAMDGSLAKKPCKTCRNRFHAGCLYKWFDSSHSSSCPLCRSEILH